MHVPRGSLRALGAALAAGALLAAASTAHAGPRTLNPQPEPPGVLHDTRAAASFSLTSDGVEIASFSELTGASHAVAVSRPSETADVILQAASAVG